MSEALTFEVPAPGDAEQFREFYLADLLRRARARVLLHPADRRRADAIGLTQEESADLLAMSVRRYREFEHGRLLHPPPAFLEQVVDVLQMGPAERVALLQLAVRRSPYLPSPRRADVRELRPMLSALGEAPALISDTAWNMLAWNRALAERVQDPALLPDAARNAMLWMFSPAARARILGVDAEFASLVGQVRSTYLAAGGRSGALQELVDRLLAVPEALRHWNDGALALQPISRPRLLTSSRNATGRVRTLYTVMPDQGLRVTVFAPEPAA